MAEQDPAVRLANALVDDFHTDHGADVEEAAAKGELATRFARDIDALRATFGKRFAPAQLGGRDPLGQALRDLAGRFGPADQVPLSLAPAGAEPAAAEPAASAAPAPAASGDDARVTRLRAALREARRRLKRLEAENQALREELLNAGEMIETLALDLEKPVSE